MKTEEAQLVRLRWMAKLLAEATHAPDPTNPNDWRIKPGHLPMFHDAVKIARAETDQLRRE